jgi:hypothetical protein
MRATTPTLTGLEPLLSIEQLSDYLHVRVKTRQDASGQVRARTRFRDDDGQVR